MVAARSVCSSAGCPELVFPAGRCSACKARANALRSATRSASRKGYDARWRRVRLAYLRAHPYCECAECEALPMPLRPAATEVDHIDGLGPLGPLGYAAENLRALTKAHHSRITARAQPGGWNDRG